MARETHAEVDWKHASTVKWFFRCFSILQLMTAETFKDQIHCGVVFVINLSSCVQYIMIHTSNVTYRLMQFCQLLYSLSKSPFPSRTTYNHYIYSVDFETCDIFIYASYA